MDAPLQRATAGRSYRFRELDGLRGLAALAVMVSHLLVSLPFWRATPVTDAIYRSPLRVGFAGSTAVALFFIMSGFVLALPYVTGRASRYGPFMTRRFFRIYVPYSAAMVAGMLLFIALAKGPLEGFSPWFNRHWEAPLNVRAVMHHILLVGEFNAGEYGLTFWTLVHEMRISLLFPLLMIPILRLPSSVALLPAAGLSVAGAMLLERGGFQIVGSSTFPVTMVVLFLFSVGALIAKHHERLCDGFRALSGTSRALLLLGGWTAGLYAFLLREVVGGKGFSEAIEFWAITAGGAVVIVWLLSAGRGTKLFSTRPVLWLGDVSYSLYLAHGIVIWSLAHTFTPLLPPPVIMVLAASVSLVVAGIAHRRIELPAMRAGKELARRMSRERTEEPIVHLPRDPSLELDVRMRSKNEIPIRIS